MSANRIAYEASVKAAGTTAATAQALAETVRQGTVAAASTSVGYRPGFGSSGAYDAACKSAALQKLADLANAKDLLRSQGEIPL